MSELLGSHITVEQADLANRLADDLTHESETLNERVEGGVEMNLLRGTPRPSCGGRGNDALHLAIAFCRCLNIPARYCTGYLGDIGIPPPSGPPDLAALVRGLSRRELSDV